MTILAFFLLPFAAASLADTQKDHKTALGNSPTKAFKEKVDSWKMGADMKYDIIAAANQQQLIDELPTTAKIANNMVFGKRNEVAWDSMKGVVGDYKDTINTDTRLITQSAANIVHAIEKESSKLVNARLQYQTKSKNNVNSLETIGQADSNAVKIQNSNMLETLSTLEGRVTKTESKYAGKANPVEKMIERKEKKARKLLTGITKAADNDAKKSEEEREKIIEAVELNAQNIMKTADTFRANFQSGFESMPDPPATKEKSDNLMKEVKGEATSRATQFEELKEAASDKSKELQRDESNAVKEKNEEYEEDEETNLRLGERMVSEVKKKSEGLSQQAEREVDGYLGTADSQFDSLENKNKKATVFGQKINDALLKQAEAEKGFPREAELEIKKVQQYAQNQFLNVREQRQAELAAQAEEFMSWAPTSSINIIHGRGEDYLADGEKKIEKVDVMTARAAGTAEEDIMQDKSELDIQQNKISALNDEEGSVNTRIKSLQQQVNRADNSIQTRIMAGDRKVLSEAKKAAVSAGKELDGYNNAVDKQAKRSERNLDRSERELRKGFDEKAEEYQRGVSKALSRATTKFAKVKDLTSRMSEKVNIKFNDIKNKLESVNDRVLPEITSDVIAFEKEANDNIDNADVVADESIANANQVVNAQMENLESSANKAVLATHAALAPLIDKNQKRVVSNKDSFTDVLDEMAEASHDQLTHSTDILDIASEQQKTNVDTLNRMDENIRDIYEDSNSHAEEANTKLVSDLAEQKAATVATEQALANKVMTAVTAAKAHSEETMEKTGMAIAHNVKRTGEATSKLGNALQKDVADGDSRLTGRADDLGSHTSVLQQMVREQRKKREAAAKALDDQVAALKQAVTDDAAAAAASQAAVQQHMDKEADAAQAVGQTQLNTAAGKLNYGLLTTGAEIAKDQQTAKADLAAKNSQADASVTNFKSHTDGEVNTLGNAVSNLEKGVAKEQQFQHQTDAEIKDQYTSLEADQDAQADLFTKEMAKAANALNAIVGADDVKMGALVESLQGVSASTKTALSSQSKDDEAFLDSMVKAARDRLTGVTEKMVEGQDRAKAFTNKANLVKQSTATAMASAQQKSTEFNTKMDETKRVYGMKIETERAERQQAASRLQDEQKTGMDHVSKTMFSIQQVAQQGLGPSMEYEVGNLKLKEDKMQKQLRSAVELEKYQDAEEMKKVAEKISSAHGMEDKIEVWKGETDKSQKVFQTLVVGEFAKLGEELDLSELELAREKAAENWMIEQQKKHLEAHLGEEIEGISAIGSSRIAALAAQAGAQIAALLKNEKLTEKERASMIEAIRASARIAASRIMEQDNHLRLDQQTAARNIKLATDEVSQSMGRIASLEGNVITGATTEVVMQKIHGLMKEATRNTAGLDAAIGAPGAPGSLVEQTLTSEQQSEEAAGLQALKSSDPMQLLQAAYKQSEADLQEYPTMQQQLRSLQNHI